MDLQLAGKYALVTGASRGIGRAIALALADQGVSVAACYHQASEQAQSLTLALEQHTNGSFSRQVDVSEESAIRNFIAEIDERFGCLNILVNNAGIVSHVPLVELSLEEWQQMISTNLTSMYLVIRAAQQLLRPGSSIINIGSAVATVGMPGGMHYTAAKAGVIGLTRSLCKELGPRQIRVNTIAPGIIDTDQASHLSPEQRTRYANLAALGRLGSPDDIAQTALFLASDLAAFVSGITLTVDGGI